MITGKRIQAGCLALIVMVIVVVSAYSLFTGPRDVSAFPANATSPYLLPWPAGITYTCVQGVRGIVSHRGRSRFGYDFYMPIGSPIAAARAGEVVRVVDHHTGYGRNWPNNLVIIAHEDGTHACYAHIKEGGCYVAEGQQVAQGEIIAASGNVGNSMMPHLHFHVSNSETRTTVPVSFRDVTRHRGIPRMFFRYTSDNKTP